MTEDSKPPRDVITIEEVSALLGPPRRTIYQLAYEDPDFPKPFKPGRRLFWVRDEILAYREEAGRVRGETQATLSMLGQYAAAWAICNQFE